MNDLEKKSIECIKNMPIEETTYQVARNVVLDYITNLQQELEDYKDTETYSKKFLYKANKDRLNANLKLIEENERLRKKITIKKLGIKYKVQTPENFELRKIFELQRRIDKAKDKAQKLKDHIDKSNFDGMTKSILIMGINEIIYILNGKE